MVEAVVEYDYTAQESDELTIRKGDVIREIIKKPGGWWEGTLRDKRGMFPDNFVSVIQKEKASLRAKPNRIRQCRAIFSYHPAHDDELNLSVGDIIDILCEVEEGWWKGRIGNEEGVFPSNFVTELEVNKSKSSSREDLASLAGEIDIPNLPPKPTKLICQVKYPYEACNEDELTLREGDLITLISKDGQDRGWWRGELRGQIGVFPDNFVVMVPAKDQNSPQPKQDKPSDKNTTTKSPLSVQKDDITSKPSQRKSLELKTDAPPLPGKKPNVPKKSPSSTAFLIQKIIDKVDGAANSRAATGEDCDFDQVERSAMLPDMRANRVKAPGRRPPRSIYRENDANLLNGNSDHQSSVSETSNDEEDDKKPKVREWEKHKAPWVEELKLNQAKRTSENDSKESSSPVDMTKSLSSLSTKLKTPPGENTSPTNVPLRIKSPVRPQSVHGNLSTTPPKPPVAEKINVDVKHNPRLSLEKKPEIISIKQFLELQERITQMETKFQQQFFEMQTSIDELQRKLQIESDLRRHLQSELEKVMQ